MSMYALLRNNPVPKMSDVEETFQGTRYTVDVKLWHLLFLQCEGKHVFIKYVRTTLITL